MERRVYLAPLDQLRFVATRLKTAQILQPGSSGETPPDAFRSKL
jgi:hypothetical protein